MKANPTPTSPPRGLRFLALALLSATLPTTLAHAPFGYQSNSAHSWEFRNGDSSSSGGGDPSTYAGAVHYDPLHHALYVTGSTFASSVFDGIDVYGLTGEEQDELHDENPANDGYWWDDLATGLRPHLMDVGIPAYSPAKGDCFYAVLGLPREAHAGKAGAAPAGSPTGGGDEDASRVKVVHSRRFGSEGVQEACSAIDVLFASPLAGAVGGYVHNFEAGMGKDVGEIAPNFPPSPAGPFGPDGPPQPPPAPSPVASSAVKPPTPFTTYSPNFLSHAPHPSGDFMENYAPTYPPTITDVPTTATRAPTRSPYPTSETGWPTLVPTATFEFGVGDLPRRLQFHSGMPEGGITHPPEGVSTTSEGDEALAATWEERLEQNQAAALSGQLQPSPGALGGSIPGVALTRTRSVRLLMAGHVESPQKKDGYAVQDLPAGMFDEATVYGFAQQVDVRLPAGDLQKLDVQIDIDELMNEQNEELDYHLHSAAKEEEELAQELDPEWKVSLPHDDFARIVTSGVESRALLNDRVPENQETVYPVALVADPTSKKHYYVAALASNNAGINRDFSNKLNADPTIGQGSSQRARTEYPPAFEMDLEEPVETDEFGGRKGRPNYGSDYRVIVKRMAIDAVEETELDTAEKALAATSYDSGKLIAMRPEWMQPFEPDSGEDVRPAGLLFAPSGDARGIDDVLILVGTTSGRGSAFGTMSEKGSATAQDKPEQRDLDGFVTKIRTDTGAFAGHNKFDSNTNQFLNMHSLRIKSNPGEDEMVAGVCAKPLRAVGMQTKMTHVYVVGSTAAVLPGIPSNTRDSEFLSKYPAREGIKASYEAFLMKVDLATMDTVWTVQIGAFEHGEGKSNYKGNAFGYGCAVTRDGQDVYLTGLVKDDGAATDFSSEDYQQEPDRPIGGTDVFLASYKTSDGSRNYLRQVGSDRDDFPSRGNGGITTDRFGNAILTGNTRGSLMRKRADSEYKYGPLQADAAFDVFVMSFDRATGDHAPTQSAGARPPVAPHVSLPVAPPTPASQPANPAPAPQIPVASEEEIETKNAALVGVVAIALSFILIAVAASVFVVYRIKQKRNKEQEVLFQNGDNLHNSRSGGSNLQSRRRSTWGMHKAQAEMAKDFNDLNIMVEVRNSASGGWHGVYDDEQLQAIDFGVPSRDADKNDVVEQSLFMEDGLKEIEESMDSYEIGEMPNMDEVSDEDLIKAYNDAMALDIEPENPDVEFAMAGLGSDLLDDDDGHHRQIT